MILGLDHLLRISHSMVSMWSEKVVPKVNSSLGVLERGFGFLLMVSADEEMPRDVIAAPTAFFAK